VKGFKEGEGGLLNRLDNETGGIVFFAKTDDGFDYYQREMKDETIRKFYLAVVEGKPEKESGMIDTQIAHHPKNKTKMVPVFDYTRHYRGNPQNAMTFWSFLKEKDGKSLLEIVITKGVRHQIRVHLAGMGHPIIGDKIYNEKTADTPYQYLYANKAVFLNRQEQRVTVETKPEGWGWIL